MKLAGSIGGSGKQSFFQVILTSSRVWLSLDRFPSFQFFQQFAVDFGKALIQAFHFIRVLAVQILIGQFCRNRLLLILQAGNHARQFFQFALLFIAELLALGGNRRGFLRLRRGFGFCGL